MNRTMQPHQSANDLGACCLASPSSLRFALAMLLFGSVIGLCTACGSDGDGFCADNLVEKTRAGPAEGAPADVAPAATLHWCARADGTPHGAYEARSSAGASSFTKMRLSKSTPADSPRYSWYGLA